MKKILAVLVLSVMCLILVGSIAQAAMLTSAQKLEAKEFKSAKKAELVQQKEVYKAQKKALKEAKKDLLEMKKADRKALKKKATQPQPRGNDSPSTSNQADVQCAATIDGIMRGDMNKDGNFNQADLQLFLQTYGTVRANVEATQWAQVWLADIDCNNEIALQDLSLLLSKLR